MAGTFKKLKEGLNLVPKTTSTVTNAGDLDFNTTTNKFTGHNGTTASPVVTEAHTATLTNKTLSGNTAVTLISGSGTLTLNTTGTITVPNATDTLVGKATTDILTNKTISGASNTITNVSLTTGVTGVLPTANGGTNKNTWIAGSIPFLTNSTTFSENNGRFFFNTTDNQLNIGNNVASGSFPLSRLQVNGTIANAIGCFNTFSSTTTIQPGVSFSKSATDTLATNALVANNERLGQISWAGSDSTNFIDAAFIRAEVDGTPGTNDMPTRLIIATTADGSASPTERLRINNAGAVSIAAFAGTAKVIASNTNKELVETTVTTADLQTKDAPSTLENYSITATVAANALTIALKTKAGTDATATDPIKLAFRNTTLTTGDYSILTQTGAASLVISSGSTLGHTNAKPHDIWIYAFNDAGTLRLGASTTLFDDNNIASSTAEGGAGAADSFNTIYTGTAVTSKAFRVLARLTSTQTTAGTWATAMSAVTTNPMLQDPIVLEATGDGATHNLTANTTTDVTWWSTTKNTHGTCFDGTTFTAPRDGWYECTSTARFASTFALGSLAIMINRMNSVDYNAIWEAGGANGIAGLSNTKIKFLTKNQTIKVQVNVGGTSPSVNSQASYHNLSIKFIGG